MFWKIAASLPGFHGCGADYLTMTIVCEREDVFWCSAKAVGYC